jgi:glycosyltransferase involved in cell wall biosynthesis
MHLKKILTLKGSSENNVLRVFVDELSSALRLSGVSVDVLDFEEHSNSSHFLEILNDKSYDGIFTFNSLLGDLIIPPSEFSFLAELKKPYIAWMVDNPIYHHARLKSEIPKRHVICPSRHHLQFLKMSKIVGNSSILLAGASNFNEQPVSFSNRNIPVLLLATWMGEPVKFWFDSEDKLVKELAPRAIELLMRDPSCNTINALQVSARSLGVKFEYSESWINFCVHLQSYIRCLDRLETVRCLANSGMPITLVGNGWESNLINTGNINFCQNIDANETWKMYDDSKVVINLNSSNGACERLFNAIGRGACVVSDESETLRDYFKINKDIAFFDRRNPVTIVNLIKELLKDTRAEWMAKRAWIKVANDHTWNNRATEILNIFKQII